jgi:hypothetical protein
MILKNDHKKEDSLDESQEHNDKPIEEKVEE